MLSATWGGCARTCGSSWPRCWREGGRDGAEVAGIGATGHGNGLYLLDRAGEPMAAVQSLDGRAAGIVAEWAADGTAEAVEALALQRPWPAQTPALLAWMLRHRPDAVERAAHLLLCKDLVTHALTGEVVSEVSDLGGAGLLALPANARDDQLLAAYGLGGLGHLLPRVLWPVEVAGAVSSVAEQCTGLRAGTPVVVGLFDVVAAAVGSGVTRPGQGSAILGTWSINQAVLAEPVRGVFLSCGFASGRFLALECSATSAVNLEWTAQRLLGGRLTYAEADRLAAAAEERPDAPFWFSHLHGVADDPAARAALIGVGGWHGSEDLLRALFEGVVFAHGAHLDRLAAAGVTMEEIVLSGGGARSPVWPQMIADLLGREVRVTLQPEAGALGAAMTAAVGAGLCGGLDEAAARMAAPARTVAPRPGRTGPLRRRFEMWRALGESLRPHWAAIAGA